MDADSTPLDFAEGNEVIVDNNNSYGAARRKRASGINCGDFCLQLPGRGDP